MALVEVSKELERKVEELVRYWSEMSWEMSWCHHGGRPPSFKKILELYPKARSAYAEIRELCRRLGIPVPKRVEETMELIEDYRARAERMRC